MIDETTRDDLVLLALGEADGSAAALLRERIESDAELRSEYDAILATLGLLQPVESSQPSEMDRLRLERDVLKKIVVERRERPAKRRSFGTGATLLRVAAAVALLFIGYASSFIGEKPERREIADARTIAKLEQLGESVAFSQIRLSPIGLRLIAKGKSAVTELIEMKIHNTESER